MSKRQTLLRALECFADPTRRDGYFHLYREDTVLHGYAGVEPGLASIKLFYQNAIWAAFPDARVHVEDMIEEGDKLACRFIMTGTHQGTFMGVAATGKAISMPGITILRFEKERCVERWSSADFVGVLAQIGALPPG